MKYFVSLVILLVVVLSITYGMAEHQGLTNPSRFSSHFHALAASTCGKWLVAATVIGLLASDLFLPIPSSIVMTLSGCILGTIPGAAASLSGAMLSSMLGFWLCRTFGQASFARLVGDKDTARVQRFLNTYGAWAVILSRSVPMLTEIMSCLAGLGSMPFRRFATLSVAGTLPLCLVYAWAGARSSDGAPTGIGWAILVAFVIPAIGFGILQWMEKHRKKLADPPSFT